MLVADTGAGAVKAIALDNLSSAPIDIASAANLRTAIFGRKPGNGQGVISSDTMIYLGILHNNGNSGATSPVLSNKLIEVLPKEPAYIWISAPEGGREGAFPQGYITISDTTNGNKSTAKVKLVYRDNKERLTYAMTGDPGRAAAYDPQPVNPSNCDKPFISVSGSCDNKDNAAICWNCVGSFKDSKDLIKSDVCGSKNNPCEFEFWITDRYGGDNYKVYFGVGDHYPSTSYISRASPIYTAVKHIHIERDKMCRNGGMLWEDPAKEPDYQTGDGYIAISKLNYQRVDNINTGDIIKIFDSENTYEGNGEVACAQYVDADASSDWVYVFLGEAGNCSQSYTLNCNYDASVPNPSTGKWDFAIGKSAGVCVEDGQFFIADTSDLSQPFSDAFVTFHISKDGFEGSNVVPYLPQEWFDTGTIVDRIRFHNIWFKNFTPSSGDPPMSVSKNYFHLIGGSKKGSGGNIVSGLTKHEYDYSYILIKSIEDIVIDYCNSLNPVCDDNQKATYIANHIRNTTGHEIAHQFNVNSGGSCTGGHCTNNAWCGGTGGNCRSSCGGGTDEWCLMHEAGAFQETVCQRVDGIDKMDCSDLSANSGCTEPDCSGPNQISVRTDYDPE